MQCICLESIGTCYPSGSASARKGGHLFMHHHLRILKSTFPKEPCPKKRTMLNPYPTSRRNAKFDTTWNAFLGMKGTFFHFSISRAQSEGLPFGLHDVFQDLASIMFSLLPFPDFILKILVCIKRDVNLCNTDK